MQNPGQGSILFPGGIKVYEYVSRQTDIDCGRRRSSSTSTVVVVGINCGRRQLPALPSSAMVGGHGCCRNRQSSSVVVILIGQIESAKSLFISVTDSLFVGVDAAVTPSAAPGIIGFPHIAGYQSIRHAPLWTASGHCGESGRGLVAVNYQIDRSIGVGLRAVIALVRSQRCRSRSRSKSMGLINSNKVVIR